CGIPPCTLRALTIGIAGGTASGKTTVARRLVERLAGHPIALLDQDAYYRDLSDMPLEERRGFNFDHPDAFDADLLVKHLQELKAGRPVEKPVYSFALHSRTGETQRRSEEHTSELQSPDHLVCSLLLEKKKQHR